MSSVEPRAVCAIRLLGGMEVRVGNRNIGRFRTQKAAALLAHLALHLGNWQSREVLAETFWPESEPRLSRMSLRTALSALRRQLEPPSTPAGALLATEGDRVRLSAEQTWVDVLAFEELLRRARQGGSPQERSALALRALDLYRGPLLPGFYEDWILNAQGRLEAAYLSALEYAAKNLLADGADEQAEELLRKGLELDPAHRGLVSLASSRGFSPGRTPAGATRKNDSTPLRVESEPRALRDSLVLPATAFFGRTEELSRVVDFLLASDPRQHRLLTVTGAGGTGKTRLAQEAAGRFREAANIPVWFVPAAESTDEASLAETLAAHLGLDRSPNRDSVDHLLEALRKAVGLVLLDNVEQVIDGAAALVRRTIDAAPGVRFLVTSRVPVGLTDERLFPLSPLPVPQGANSGPEAVSLIPSVQLFVDRAQAVRPDFQLTPATAPVIAELCRRLEGIPLAIELAAARIRVVALGEMLRQLARRFDLLQSRRRDLPARHRSLRAAIDWSYELLPHSLQRFFARLSVFHDGWDLAGAASVATEADAAAPQSVALESLEALQEASLVIGSPGPKGTMRFRMLESIREYGRDKLQDDFDPTARRLTEYLLARATPQNSRHGGEALAIRCFLETERENLRFALDWAIRHDAGLGLRLAAASWELFHFNGPPAEGRDRLVKFLAATSPSGTEEDFVTRSRALFGAGSLARDLGDLAGALEHCREQLALQRPATQIARIARTFLMMGTVECERGFWEEGRKHLRKARRLSRESGWDFGAVEADLRLASIAQHHGQLADAERMLRECLARFQQLDNPVYVMVSLNALAGVLYAQGRYLAAKCFYEECLVKLRSLNCGLDEAEALMGLACCQLAISDPEGAEAFANRAYSLVRDRGDRPWIANALQVLAAVSYSKGDAHQAARLLGATERVRRTCGLAQSDWYAADRRSLEAKLRERLGNDAYEAAFLSGSSEYQHPSL